MVEPFDEARCFVHPGLLRVGESVDDLNVILGAGFQDPDGIDHLNRVARFLGNTEVEFAPGSGRQRGPAHGLVAKNIVALFPDGIVYDRRCFRQHFGNSRQVSVRIMPLDHFHKAKSAISYITHLSISFY
jgi:hypothetical protein